MSSIRPERTEAPRVLMIDDDRNALDAVRRRLRNEFDIVACSAPREGLELIQSDGPFSVVVSDLMMPGMNGVELLARARALSPETVRILITGHADLDAALAAVNRGHVFRFLTKPLDARLLADNIDAAVAQHDLIVAERVLLKETLNGAVRALVELLGLTNPHIFGHATAIKQRATAIAERLGAEDDWTIGVAAMLSRVGEVTLHPETVAKLRSDFPLTPPEREAVAQVPEVVDRLLENIPRMEPVREILALQSTRFVPRRTALPLGARILKASVDFSALEIQGLGHEEAVAKMRAREGWYDPDVLEALAEEIETEDTSSGICRVRLSDLDIGCRLAEDLLSDSGILLLARGQEVDTAILARIRSTWSHVMGDRTLTVYRPPRPRPVPAEPT